MSNDEKKFVHEVAKIELVLNKSSDKDQLSNDLQSALKQYQLASSISSKKEGVKHG